MSTDKEMNTYDFFLSTTKQKAHENEKAFNLLYENKMYVTCVYLLRIQLDCYVRLLYLKEQTEEKRTVLLENFYQGSRWKISDRNMLETVSRYGWEKNVYTLSCSFIHLSRLSNINDENDENILDYLSEEDKTNIVRFINNYHGASLTIQSTNQELIQYIPNIMKKITENLLYSLDEPI